LKEQFKIEEECHDKDDNGKFLGGRHTDWRCIVARKRRKACRSATSEGREVIEAEENKKEKTRGRREKGAGTREGEKKSRTLNRPLALGLRIKRYDRRGRRGE